MVDPGRRFHAGIAGLGLVVYLWGFACQTRVAAWPATVEVGSYPVRLDGRPAGSMGELRRLAEAYSPGTDVRLDLADGSVREVTLPAAHPVAERAVILLSGLLFWGVSVFIFLPRIRRQGVRDFFWCFFLYGLAVMIGGVYFPRPPLGSGLALNALQILSLAFLPPFFVHLTLSFPRRDAILDRHRWILAALFGAALGLAGWQWSAYQAYYAAPGPAPAQGLERAVAAGSAAMVAQVGAGILILFGRGRRLELTRERDQMKTLLWGFFVGVAPYVFLRQLPRLVGLTPPLGSGFDRGFELIIPLIVLFAVARYRMLDIDLIIRRSLIYGTMALLLVGVYLGLGLLAGRRLERWNWAVLMATGLGAGMLFQPTQRWIGGRVDRIFFKLRTDYSRRLDGLADRLRRASGQEEVARTLVRFLAEALSPAPLAVCIREGPGFRVAGDLPEAAACRLARDVLSGLPGGAGLLAAPGRTSLPEVEQPAFPRQLLEAGVVLVHPLGASGEREGWMLLGPKQSGWRYVDPDLELIRRGGEVAAIHLERIGLVQTLIRESVEKDRLAELDRMKTDFFSGVAHDLRTPLTAITWSAGNLLDGVAGTLSEPQGEYLASIRTEASRLHRMVEALLEINRVEHGRVPVALEPLDLEAVAADAVRTLRARASGGSVALTVRVEEPVRVQGDRDKVFEVMVNLLENAIKVSPAAGTVDVGVGRRNGEGGFWVRDQGPGFEPDASAGLFERYRRGASPQGSRGQGFGLGLYIVKRYMELMGGRVEAGLHPEGGAVFSCLWPGVPGGEGGAS